jgi:hypothetical protein
MLARPSLVEHASDASRALVTVIEHLPRLDTEGRGLTTREIVQLLYPQKISEAERSTDGFDALRDALEAWAPPKPGQPPSIVAVGKRLRSSVGRVIGGKRICRDENTRDRGVMRWVVR